jgi:Domain of unknown function (DUF4279)
LNTSDVTLELGIEPTKVVEVGDRLLLGSAKVPVWMWEARTQAGKKEWDDLGAGLQQVIDVFGARKETLAKLRQRWEVLLFCGYHTDELGGPTLSPAVLRGLGDLGVEFFLDTYVFGPEEQADSGAESK